MGQEKWHKALATSCLAADPCGAAVNHYTGHSCRHTFCTRRTLLEALRIQPGEGPCGPALLYSFLRLTEPSWPFPLCLYPTVRPPTPLPPPGERVFKVTPPHERFREPDHSLSPERDLRSGQCWSCVNGRATKDCGKTFWSSCLILVVLKVWTSSIMWELVNNVDSQAPSRTYWVGKSGHGAPQCPPRGSDACSSSRASILHH